MTETVQTTGQPGLPAAGWYPDPAGSGGRRWWDGHGWTQTVQLPAPPVIPLAPVAPAAPVAAEPAVVAPPAAVAYAVSVPLQATPLPQLSAFGGPVEPTHAAGMGARAAVPSHRAAATPRSTGSSMSGTTKAGLGVAALVLLGVLVYLLINMLSGADGTPASPGTGGPRGPAAQAAAKLDALSLAAAEETVYAGRQSYLAFPASTGVVEMGATVVHLSPTDRATARLNPSGTGYCIVVTSTSHTSGASSTVVYVSTLGGLQPLATTCPASY